VPGAVPQTSTHALTHVTLPYIEAIAERGLVEALRSSLPLARGVNVLNRRVTNHGVAAAHGLDYTPINEVIA